MNSDLPLQNRRIIITRPADKAQLFAQKLEALGAQPIILPSISIKPLANFSAIDELLFFATQKYPKPWFIFTSVHAVEAIMNRATLLNLDFTLISLVAIGPVTAQKIASYGLCPQIIAEAFSHVGVVAAMKRQLNLDGVEIILPQSQIAPSNLKDLLEKEGAKVCAVEAYRTEKNTLSSLNTPPFFDAITFASPSAVEGFSSNFEARDALAKVICIGPSTASAAQLHGWTVTAIANPYTTEGLVQALIRVLGDFQ